MKVLNKLDSLDNINDGETRKLPTKTSQLTNDSGYITSANVPTKVSELQNDSGYITDYTETDPVFSASAAAGITSSNITNWNKAVKYNSWDTSNHLYKVSYNSSVAILLEVGLNGKVDIDNLPTESNIATQSDTVPTTRAVYSALFNKQDKITSSNKLDYSLVSNTPTIPTKTSELTNDSNFNYSIEKATGTIDDLAAFTSGKPGLTGSINITKKDSGVGSEIAAGWYNYFFSPHRTGSGGDNGNYGTIILTPMNFAGSSYILRRSSSATTITDVKKIAIGDIPTKVSQLTNDSNFITNTGSTSGNAGTATTLQTYTYNRNNSTNTWFKVATTTMPKTSTYGERHAFLFIKGSHNSNYNQNGIIAIDAVGNSNKGKIGSYNAQFMSATQDLNLENFYIEFLDGDTETDGIVNFWIRANTNNYASWQVKILQNTGWTIASSSATATTMPSTNYTGKKAVLAGSVARSIGDKNGDDITTTYYKASNPNGYTSNTGTITGITMNGTSKGTSGVVDLGTVATTDTKNTTGSTDTSSKIFLVGATSQAVNPQTYSDNEVYTTSGVLTTKSVQIGGTAATMQYNSTDKCIEFVFA